MPITKAKKQEILSKLKGIVDNNKTFTFVSFKGLPANDQVVLRKDLFKANVGYTVVKKTLLKKVLGEKGITGDMPVMDGEIAFAYSVDQLAAPREAFNFSKTHKAEFSIVGGIFDGAYKSKTDMLSIATIPGREVLLSQIAYLLKSPLQRLAIAVNEVSKTKN
jgi:large subunit ribosomal protein L10